MIHGSIVLLCFRHFAECGQRQKTWLRLLFLTVWLIWYFIEKDARVEDLGVRLTVFRFGGVAFFLIFLIERPPNLKNVSLTPRAIRDHIAR